MKYNYALFNVPGRIETMHENESPSVNIRLSLMFFNRVYSPALSNQSTTEISKLQSSYRTLPRETKDTESLILLPEEIYKLGHCFFFFFVSF